MTVVHLLLPDDVPLCSRLIHHHLALREMFRLHVRRQHLHRLERSSAHLTRKRDILANLCVFLQLCLRFKLLPASRARKPLPVHSPPAFPRAFLAPFWAQACPALDQNATPHFQHPCRRSGAALACTVRSCSLSADTRANLRGHFPHCTAPPVCRTACALSRPALANVSPHCMHTCTVLPP